MHNSKIKAVFKIEVTERLFPGVIHIAYEPVVNLITAFFIWRLV